MKNMKSTQPAASEVATMSPAKREEYPYGLRLHLCEEDLKKLGIKDMPAVGSKMKLVAMVEVCDINISESKLYGENRGMGLQITDMELGKSES